ncbi:MAG: BrnT family toxin [Rhodoplanes sp.]
MTAELPSFEWNAAKDRLNRTKHGVSFALALRACFDPPRVIAGDLSHGGAEQRYFCFGWVDGGVMTVRFTWRDGRIASLGRAIGEREGRFMTGRTVKYTAGEIGPVRVIPDFLPAPDALVPREDNVKVTLALSRRSVEFFKQAAKKRGVPYQRMIRALVDTYAERQATAPARRSRG